MALAATHRHVAMKPEYAKDCSQSDIDGVLADYMRRVDRGEIVDVESLIKANPHLSAEIRDYFSRAAVMERYAAVCDATVNFSNNVTPVNRQLYCPHCHKPIESGPEAPTT